MMKRTLRRWYEAGRQDAFKHGRLNPGFPQLGHDHQIYEAMREAGFRAGQRELDTLALRLKDAAS